MSTNRIPEGTVNLSLNICSMERVVLGRVAADHGESIGAVVRRCVLLGLSRLDPMAASEISDARKSRTSHSAQEQ